MWCFWTVVLEKTLESPLDCKKIQPVLPKGNQSWIFIGRTDAEAETPKLWLSDVKNWLIWKDPDAGKNWRQEEKGMTEDETVGWHHRLDGHEFEQALGVGDGKGSLACCSPWGHKESDTTEWLDWTDPQLNLEGIEKLNISITIKESGGEKKVRGVKEKYTTPRKIHQTQTAVRSNSQVQSWEKNINYSGIHGKKKKKS